MQYTITNSDSENQLIESFLDFTSRKNAATITDALYKSVFDHIALVNVLSTYGMKANPTRGNIRMLVLKAAKSELYTKPSTALNGFHYFCSFFEGMSKNHVGSWYETAKPTNLKVLEYIDFSTPLDQNEDTAFQWLERYIDECDHELLVLFLRYCTGANIILPGIRIACTSKIMSEGEARPIAKTCMKLLTVPRNLSSYHSFKTKFNFFLTRTEYWTMQD